MRLERVQIAELERLGGPSGVAAHLRALVPDGDSVEAPVREIVRRVRDEGDAAVLDYTRRFDTQGSEPRPLLVAPEELDEAIKRLPLELVAGLQVTISNVAQVADAGVGRDATVDLPQGQRIALRELPVDSAAVYVPGGRAPYPSTVAMGVVTARAAGVFDVAVCTPPGPDGQIDDAILGACRLCGVERVYRMGGAQAIAALAYGTESVARVDVIVGPGNLYVQEAKAQLSAKVGIDGFAGPSDLLVVLGGELGPNDVELAALDMLAQGEHGEGSLVVGVSAGPGVVEALSNTLERLNDEHPTAGGTFALVEAIDSRQAVQIANAFAPEHLQLIGADVEAQAPRVRAAGCLFVGRASATAFGDYVVGSNHILPTSGAARFASMLSPRHFRRRMAEVRIAPEGAGKLAGAGVPIARAEGFEWHARSMEARIGDNERSG
ncbi:MAG TPA: histidinol dehydrogenase [Solirubrobacteraceae bacterium]|jgi:histidinol dehydrogenase|nr:histidinol dehydrogenase [Solirubrobacteraceae bacterium]